MCVNLKNCTFSEKSKEQNDICIINSIVSNLKHKNICLWSWVPIKTRIVRNFINFRVTLTS